MSDGFSVLRQWLVDLMAQGLSQAAVQPVTFWENMAARMVDAKLPGPARTLRSIPELVANDSDWPEKVLGHLGSLYLLTTSFDRLHDLPEGLQTELLHACGVKFTSKTLEPLPGVTDSWLVLSEREMNSTEDLRYKVTWMLGHHTGRIGVVLEFAYGYQDFKKRWRKDTAYQGEAVFYPSARPRRMAFKGEVHQEKAPETVPPPSCLESVEALKHHWNEALATGPWMTAIPVAVKGCIIRASKERFWLKDHHNRSIELVGDSDRLWTAFAHGYGRPVTLLAEANEHGLAPVGVWRGMSFHSF